MTLSFMGEEGRSQEEMERWTVRSLLVWGRSGTIFVIVEFNSIPDGIYLFFQFYRRVKNYIICLVKKAFVKFNFSKHYQCIISTFYLILSIIFAGSNRKNVSYKNQITCKLRSSFFQLLLDKLYTYIASTSHTV